MDQGQIHVNFGGVVENITENAVGTISEMTINGGSATSATITNNISTLPGAGGTVSFTVTTDGKWRCHSNGRPFDGQLRDLAGSVIGNISPVSGGKGSHEISVTTGPLSSFTNGSSVISGSWQINVTSDASTTALATTSVSQSRDVGPEVRFVSSIPSSPIASVLYITPS